MDKYFQLITPDEKTETWTFEQGANNYNKYIAEGLLTDETVGWHIEENPLNQSQVENIDGIQELTFNEYKAYFIPGSRPPIIPRP